MVGAGPLSRGDELQNERYTIIEKIGQGGMGYVYKASDNAHGGCIVALKELKQDGLRPEDLPGELQHFQKEANTLQQLTPHPHIPQYYDRFEDRGRYFIVMEFVDGDTLQALIDSSPAHQIPVEQVIKYGIQLCNALSHLHQQSPPIILRDLKPANVKVTPDERVYLLDFGIAREYKQGKTLDTTVRYTEGFAAPELSREQTEPRFDLYSLGAVLHYCLSGNRPKDSVPFQHVRTFNLQVSKRLDTLIQKLVATRKEDRPPNALIVLQQLETIKKDAANNTQPATSTITRSKMPFFNWQTALMAQLHILWSQRNTLPNLAALCVTILIHFCSALGDWIRFDLSPWIILHWQKLWRFVGNTAQRFSAQCKQLQAKLAITIQRPNLDNCAVPTSQQSQQGLKFVRGVFGKSEEIAHGVVKNSRTITDYSGELISRRTEVPPNLVPFVGVFAIVACCTIGMLAVLHLSPYDVLFTLATILLLISFSASVQREIDKLVQHIFMATMIVALLVCFALMTQPDVKRMLASITVNLLVCLLIGAFVLTSLFRSARSNLWVDYIAVLLIAIACATQQYLLGPQELQSLMPSITSSTATTICEIIAAIVLVAVVSGSLFRLHKPYTKGFVYSVLPIACIAMPLQFTFGKQDLPMPTEQAIQAQLTTFTWIFLFVLGASIIIAGKFLGKAEQADLTQGQSRQNRQNVQTSQVSRIPWERMGRIPLVFVIIPCLLLQYYVGTMHTQQTPDGITQFLKMRPLDPVRVNQTIVSVLVLVVTMLLLSWFRRCAAMLINTLANAGIGITCVLLHASLWDGNTTLTLLHINKDITPFLAWIVTIMLLLLAISVSLHLYHPFSWFLWLTTRIDWLIGILGYIILTICAFLCTFFFHAYGNQLPALRYSPPIQDVQFTIGQVATVCMAVVTGIYFIMLLISLRHPSAASNVQNIQLSPGQPPGRKEIPWSAIRIFVNRLLLIVLLSSLLFITWNIQGWQTYMYPALPTMLTRLYPLIPLPVWLAEYGLLLIVGFSYFKLDLSFERIKHATIELFFVLALIGKALATACIILLFAGMLPTLFTWLFAVFEIICLILLIQTVLLIAWAEKESQGKANRQSH